ncbi:N-acetyltransferase family protein [Pseudomonas monsensis]
MFQRNVAEIEHRIGVGHRLYRWLFPLLTRQGFNLVHAGIALPNAGSLVLHQRWGFFHAGAFASAAYKFGMWLDVSDWRVELSTRSNSPSKPRLYLKIAGRSSASHLEEVNQQKSRFSRRLKFSGV